jgi:hypothetical protein
MCYFKKIVSLRPITLLSPAHVSAIRLSHGLGGQLSEARPIPPDVRCLLPFCPVTFIATSETAAPEP